MAVNSIRNSVQHGIRCHDATLERTTNGQGTAGDLPWGALARFDAGAWHSRAYAGETLPTLENVVRWCLANGLDLNVEIKPTPGTEDATGRAVASLLARLWPADRTAPLLTSFQPAALDGARAAAPALQPEQADQGLGIGHFAAGAGGVQRLGAHRRQLQELALVEPALAGHQAAGKEDLDALGRVGDRVVQQAGMRPLPRGVAGLLLQFALRAGQRRLARVQLAGRADDLS